jgi:cation diffusion facilitator family transporter
MSKSTLATTVARINLISNAFLAITKILIGYFAHSAALLNDGINNLGDTLSSIITMVGISAGSKKADDDHQYGHERLESVAAILLSGIIMFVGIALFGSGVSSIIKRTYLDTPVPAFPAVIASLASIIIKGAMYIYTRWAGKKVGSPALMASAGDSLSDVFATSGGLIGILFSRMGYPIGDAVAAVVIAVFIFRVGVQIFRDGMNQMVDRACDESFTKEVRALIEAQEGVLKVDLLRTRQFGSRCYVDVEIAADPNQTLTEAHSIAERVHKTIEASFPTVKHCMVHVNPSRKKKS